MAAINAIATSVVITRSPKYSPNECRRFASVACTARSCRLVNMRTGVVMASPSENCPTMKELPSFASAITMPHWQAAYTTFPLSAQAKLERHDIPPSRGAT